MSDFKVWAKPSRECRLCHRIGTRQFSPAGGEGWECSNDRACAAAARLRRGWGSVRCPDCGLYGWRRGRPLGEPYEPGKARHG